MRAWSAPRRDVAPRVALHLTLHLTDRCNLACRYCYARPGTADMSFETACAAIEQCATGPDCGIIFFGGEPLLRAPLIWKIMDWCETRRPGRFHYKVTTNGTLLDEAFLDEAVRRGLHVALSHDGAREAHDAFRVGPGGGGTFDVVDAALARKVAEAYGQYRSEDKILFGVFFEPLADRGVAQPKLEGLSSEQARRASWEYERMRKAVEGEKSRDKLRRQVRHFVEFLKKEGVVGAPP